jgi:hypothetical protein
MIDKTINRLIRLESSIVNTCKYSFNLKIAELKYLSKEQARQLKTLINLAS